MQGLPWVILVFHPPPVPRIQPATGGVAATCAAVSTTKGLRIVTRQLGMYPQPALEAIWSFPHSREDSSSARSLRERWAAQAKRNVPYQQGVRIAPTADR